MPEQLRVIDAEAVADVESLSRELADAYRRRIEWYRRAYGDTWAEAFTDHQAAGIDFKRRAVVRSVCQVGHDPG